MIDVCLKALVVQFTQQLLWKEKWGESGETAFEVGPQRHCNRNNGLLNI